MGGTGLIDRICGTVVPLVESNARRISITVLTSTYLDLIS